MQFLRTLFALFVVCAAAPLAPLEEDGLQNDYYYYNGSEVSQPEETEQSQNVAQRLSNSNPTVPMHYILSLSTGQFLAITRSGRVNANSPIGRLVAQFIVFYRLIDGREHVSLQSVKYANRGWYLTVRPNGRLRGAVPSNGNEVFEVISTSGASVALKLRRVREDTDGSGESTRSDVEDCFVGFSSDSEDGRPRCYNTASHIETQLLFLDSGL